MSIPSFQHIAAPLRLYSGPDSLNMLGRELDRVNSQRAVIFSGPTLARSPVLELVRSAMGGRCAGTFTGVRAHSPRPTVEAAAAALRTLQADAVVAVGGGSAIVTARAASIVLAESADLESLSTSRDARGHLRSPKLAQPKLPQLIVPTTPTTAAVKAGSAVFDAASAQRLALFDPKTRVQALFIHPELLLSAPRALVLSAGLDTLSMAIEGLTSRSGDPIADASLMHAVRLLALHLPDPAMGADAAPRSELMLAAVLCGGGTDHAGAGIATVLGHAIGANHAVENGVAKAIVLPHALRFNAEAAEGGLRKVAAALALQTEGEAPAGPVIERLLRLFDTLSLPRRLRDIGIPRDALPAIASRGMADWFLRGSARQVHDASELQRLLEAAW